MRTECSRFGTSELAILKERHAKVSLDKNYSHFLGASLIKSGTLVLIPKMVGYKSVKLAWKCVQFDVQILYLMRPPGTDPGILTLTLTYPVPDLLLFSSRFPGAFRNFCVLPL